MNRLEDAPMATLAPSAPRSASSHQAEPWRLGTRQVGAPRARKSAQPIATFAPAQYEPNYKYPLLVWLHGAESSEGELPVVMPHVSLQNMVAVAPRGDDSDAEGKRFCWSQSLRGIGHAEDAVEAAIEKAERRFSVHKSRVFIGGVGQGGAMAMRLALRQPEWFAGAISIDGPLPQGRQLLARIKAARDLPLLIASSRDSQSYPQASVCRDLSLLHAAGIGVDVRQYPGNETLTTEMLADINRWVMDRIGACS